MTKERKQANITRKLSYFFFLMLFINIIFKVMGISTLDTSEAITASHAMGIKIMYFAFPVLFLMLGAWLFSISKAKSVQAESIEVSGCYW